MLLVGLEMDVRGPVIDGVEQHFLYELDHRGVIDILPCGLIGLGRSVLVEKVEVDVVVGEISGGASDADSAYLLTRGCQFGLFDDDRVNSQAGLEADLVQGPQIGRQSPPTAGCRACGAE